MIDIPDEFLTFGLWLHQDSAYIYGPQPEVMFAGALRHVPPERRAVLRDFVDRVLASNYSEAELLDLYDSSGAEIGPRGKDGGRKTFALIRATLDAGCVPYYGPL